MLYSLKMGEDGSIIESLDERVLNSFYKGIPISAHGQSIRSFLKSRPNLFTAGFQFPVAILRESAIENNLRRMNEYCKEVGASISPHVKTTMSPQLARRQMDHGAWAITVANYSQANIFLDFGFRRIIIANEIVDLSAIRQIATEHAKSGVEIFFYIDSSSGLERIEKALEGLDEARLHLFIEIGRMDGRGGIRILDQVEALVREAAKDPRLSIRGVAGFEGIILLEDRSPEEIGKVRDFCKTIVEAAKIVRPYVSESEMILTAGGSSYFDIVAEEFRKFGQDVRIVLRSGGYISHDHGGYESTYPFSTEEPSKRFLPAIELWAQVLSQPEPHLAILNFGKRDAGNDSGNPNPIKRYNGAMDSIVGVIDHLNDQHGYLKFDDNQEILVGDLVGMGISHPCTTFDKWRLIPVVNDDYDVIDLIHTFF